jgi:hypothetical protein
VESTYPETRCTFCDLPVLIETAKTNERGQLIHEDCYMQSMQSLQVNRVPSANAGSDSNSTRSHSYAACPSPPANPD